MKGLMRLLLVDQLPASSHQRPAVVSHSLTAGDWKLVHPVVASSSAVPIFLILKDRTTNRSPKAMA